MTPAKRIDKAFSDAQLKIGAYRKAGSSNAEETLDQLIRIIDDRELSDAIVELLLDEGCETTLAPV
jgi:hypothetical protein